MAEGGVRRVDLASALALPAAAMSAAFVEALVSQGLRESLTLEFKETVTPRLPQSVAAMANSYGGLILVGITDGLEVKGVPVGTDVTVVNLCFAKLDPPVVPDVALVRDVGSERVDVLAIRIDPARMPRPLVVDGKVWIRLHGRNAPADRTRMRELFTVTSAPRGVSAGGVQLLPSRWHKPTGMDDVPTFVTRAVLRAQAAGGRTPPLGTTVRDDLRRRLSESSLMGWRKEKLRISDRHADHTWAVQGVNTSIHASLILAAPEDDAYVPTLRVIVSVGGSATDASCVLVLDSIQQGAPSKRPVDEFIDLCLVLVNSVVSETGLPFVQDLFGSGLWVEGMCELSMECAGSHLSDWIDLSRFRRLPESSDSQQFNTLALTAEELRTTIRPLVVDWLTRLLLDLGYYEFEDILQRWRI